MPSVYDPVNVLRCERTFCFAGQGGNLQSVLDCLGKMEVDFLPLAGPSPDGASPGRCRISARKDSSSRMRLLFSSNHPRESRPGRVDTVIVVFSFPFFMVIPPVI